MFDGKFITTLIALVIAVITICNMNKNSVSSVENYMPSLQVKTQTIASPPNLQSPLSPRFFSGGLGSLTKMKPTAVANQAYIQNNPMGVAEIPCKQKYHDEVKTTNALPDYTAAMDEDNSLLPVPTMETPNENGETVTPVMFDRLIYTNRNSRTRGEGDHIRGDLPIVPCKGTWFNVSASPSTDLQQGALNVLAGTDNSTTQELARLINNSGASSTIAGLNYMANTNHKALLDGPRETVQTISFQ